ncbi:MAG TPA: lamin tail domain-containing protein [Pedococcus sp.]|jgi:hypothetical protein
MRLRPVAPVLLAAALTGSVAIALPAASGAATPPVKITKVFYDSPGSDRGSNSSLNAEYVRITNTTSTARSLTGWTLKDKQGFTYRFPSFTLKARASVYVHTGKGTATSTHRYYNRTWYVWNNTGDTAYLRDSRGALKDSWAFKAKGSAGYVTR